MLEVVTSQYLDKKRRIGVCQDITEYLNTMSEQPIKRSVSHKKPVYDILKKEILSDIIDNKKPVLSAPKTKMNMDFATLSNLVEQAEKHQAYMDDMLGVNYVEDAAIDLMDEEMKAMVGDIIVYLVEDEVEVSEDVKETVKHHVSKSTTHDYILALLILLQTIGHLQRKIETLQRDVTMMSAYFAQKNQAEKTKMASKIKMATAIVSILVGMATSTSAFYQMRKNINISKEMDCISLSNESDKNLLGNLKQELRGITEDKIKEEYNVKIGELEKKLSSNDTRLQNKQTELRNLGHMQQNITMLFQQIGSSVSGIGGALEQMRNAEGQAYQAISTLLQAQKGRRDDNVRQVDDFQQQGVQLLKNIFEQWIAAFKASTTPM